MEYPDIRQEYQQLLAERDVAFDKINEIQNMYPGVISILNGFNQDPRPFIKGYNQYTTDIKNEVADLETSLKTLELVGSLRHNRIVLMEKIKEYVNNLSTLSKNLENFVLEILLPLEDMEFPAPNSKSSTKSLRKRQRSTNSESVPTAVYDPYTLRSTKKNKLNYNMNSPYESGSISIDSLESFLPPARSPTLTDYIPFSRVPLWNKYENEFIRSSSSKVMDFFLDYIIQKYPDKGLGVIYEGIKLMFNFLETQNKLLIERDEYLANNLYDKLSDPKVGILLIPLRIYGEENGKAWGHANIIIINKHFGTIELLEPHGSYSHMHTKGFFYDYSVSDVVKKYLFEKVPELKDNFTFMTYDQTCPRINFQTIESRVKPSLIQKIGSSLPFFSKYFKDIGGYCIFWTMFMAELRIRYYNKSPQYIQEKYIKKYGDNPKIFYDFIRKYMKFLTSRLETDNWWNEYPHKNSISLLSEFERDADTIYPLSRKTKNSISFHY